MEVPFALMGKLRLERAASPSPLNQAGHVLLLLLNEETGVGRGCPRAHRGGSPGCAVRGSRVLRRSRAPLPLPGRRFPASTPGAWTGGSRLYFWGALFPVCASPFRPWPPRPPGPASLALGAGPAALRPQGFRTGTGTDSRSPQGAVPWPRSCQPPPQAGSADGKTKGGGRMRAGGEGGAQPRADP